MTTTMVLFFLSFLDWFDEAMGRRDFQIALFITFTAFIAWFFGTGFYYLGGFYGESWDDLSLLEAIWQVGGG